jgi:transposase
MSDPQVVVGIAVSPAQLDVARRPTNACWHVHTDASGLAGLVERLGTVQPTRIVLAATGGLEVPAAGALAAAGLPVVVVHPRHARDVAQATGRLATTDSLDARGLAHGAAPAHALSAVRTRRRPWVPRRTAERRRLQTAPQPIQADIQAPIPWWTRRLARTEAAVAAAIHSSPRWRATDAMRQRTPGVGPLRARTLVAEVPEVGGLNRQESAALMGVAPLHRESGTGRGTRAVWGGRAPVRAGLSMSPLAAVRHHPVLKAFDERRRAVGKAPQVALTACMRKLLTRLNARLNHRTPWHANYATHA